jgi:hypothetical protein
VLMVLLAREEKGGTSVRLETGRRRRVRSPAWRSGLSAREEEEERVKKGQ